jgi:hypothetical protein
MNRVLMQLNLRCVVVAGVALLLGGTAASRADGMSPGEWKLTEAITMNGQKSPPSSRTRCMTPEQTSDLEKLFTPAYRTTNSDCERVEFSSTPTALRWRMKCTGQLDMDVSGDFSFDTPKHYTATITSKGTMAGRLVADTSVAIEGERIGDCQ